jgi:hypothetical protein
MSHPPPTYEDVNLILRLYELRREDKMRTARAWFSGNFKFKSAAEFSKACPASSEMNAYARQVMSHWDMVASFVNAGVLNQGLFFESGRELLFAWTRIEPLVAEWRTLYQDPNYLKNLETVGTAFAEHLKKLNAEAYENWVKRVRG